MQRVLNFDSKALELLYNRYSPLLFTIIKKITADEKVAENILSDVFAIIWKKANYFNFDNPSPYTWIVTLARNKAVDALKRRNAENQLPPYDEEYENNFIIPNLSESISPLTLETALSMKPGVENALNSMTDAQKYVIYLAYYEGLTQTEIAKKLNIPLPTVKTKIRKALSSFKDQISNERSNAG
jgi:RNA polymerase sigma-70 factor, ECF subfamily